MSNQIAASLFVHMSDENFIRLSRYIEETLGIKMPPNKRKLLEGRLQKRLRFHGLNSFDDYLSMLFQPQGRNGELSFFVDEVTTNKTDFFRDPEHFTKLAELLESEIEPNLRKPAALWSVASSSGEEPYTLAMVCSEFARKRPQFNFSIKATDISRSILGKAIRAVYDQEQASNIPVDLQKRYLLRGTGDWSGTVRFRPEIRSRVDFYCLNLMDQNYGFKEGFDIVFCRNVLIYFDKEKQDSIMRRIYHLMNPGAFLFMGPTEGMMASLLPLEKVNLNVFRKPR